MSKSKFTPFNPRVKPAKPDDTFPLFAHNNGYPKNVWTALGFIGGIWAVAVLILLPRRAPTAPAAPTRSMR